MKEVVKIVVKGGYDHNCYGEPDTGVLTITPKGTSYKEIQPDGEEPYTWSYKVKSEGYLAAFKEIVRNLNVVLDPKEVQLTSDACELQFIVTYNDKSKDIRTYASAIADDFPDFFSAISNVIPYYAGHPHFTVLYSEEWR